MSKAFYQIPLCVWFVFLVVHILRLSAVRLLDYLIRRTEAKLERQ